VSPYRNRRLAPVGSYGARQKLRRIQDLAGNAAEWVADWFTGGVARIDTGPGGGTAKVTPAVLDPPERLRAAKHMYAWPDN